MVFTLSTMKVLSNGTLHTITKYYELYQETLNTVNTIILIMFSIKRNISVIKFE